MVSFRNGFLLLLLVQIGLLPGCVRRRMTIRSNPPGALVYVDDQKIGVTPVSTSFTYYGTRKFRLIQDGFETQTAMQKFSPPWYQIPGVDFVTENLVPYEFRDEREVSFDMIPQRVVSNDELLGRANALRSATQAGYTVPPVPANDNVPSLPTESPYPAPFYPDR